MCEDIETVIEFGGVWKAEMAYLKNALKKAKIGIEVDNIKPKKIPSNISYIQGDFRDPKLLGKLKPADLVILFDIILHQYDALSAFDKLVNKSKKYVAFNQPVFETPKSPIPNSMFFLPGRDYSVYETPITKLKSFRIEKVSDFGKEGFYNPNKWYWAMSSELIKTWFEFLGFNIIYENEEPVDLWNGWKRWGCLAKRENNLY